MIKNQVLMTASISGVIGLISGMFLTSWFWLESNATFARSAAVAKAETGIVTKVALLEHLRSARYNNAITELEALLDTDLVGAGSFARDGVTLSRNTLQAVETERRARGRSGYEPTSEAVNIAVHEVFNLVPTLQTGMATDRVGASP